MTESEACGLFSSRIAEEIIGTLATILQNRRKMGYGSEIQSAFNTATPLR